MVTIYKVVKWCVFILKIIICSKGVILIVRWILRLLKGR